MHVQALYLCTRGWDERKERSSQQRIDGFQRRKKRDLKKEIQRVSLWIGIKNIFGSTVHVFVKLRAYILFGKAALKTSETH